MRAAAPGLVATMFVVASWSVSLAAQAPPDSPDPDVVAVGERERALATAMHARDRDGLERLLAPDFVLRGAPDIDRATWIRNAVSLCWGDRSDIDALRVSRHDRVVVASLELTFYADPATCRPAVLRSLITDVWTRHADGWRLEMRHAGPPPAGGDIAAQFGAVPPPPPVWELSSELSMVATAGNTSTSTVGMGGIVTHRADTATTLGSIAFLTSQTDAITRARSLTMQARHGIQVGRVELFGEGTYARDRFAGIDARTAGGGGVAYTTSLSPRQTLTAEGGLGFASERRRDATRLRFGTATGAFRYAWTIVPGTEMTENAGLTADLGQAGNWRGVSTTALSVTVTGGLSLKASHAIEYRNTPVVTFRRLDMRSAAALVLAWQGRPGGR